MPSYSTNQDLEIGDFLRNKPLLYICPAHTGWGIQLKLGRDLSNIHVITCQTGWDLANVHVLACQPGCQLARYMSLSVE